MGGGIEDVARRGMGNEGRRWRQGGEVEMQARMQGGGDE